MGIVLYIAKDNKHYYGQKVVGPWTTHPMCFIVPLLEPQYTCCVNSMPLLNNQESLHCFVKQVHSTPFHYVYTLFECYHSICEQGII